MSKLTLVIKLERDDGHTLGIEGTTLVYGPEYNHWRNLLSHPSSLIVSAIQTLGARLEYWNIADWIAPGPTAHIRLPLSEMRKAREAVSSVHWKLVGTGQPEYIMDMLKEADIILSKWVIR